MRNVLAIADKELRSYFSSPIGYVIIGFFALLFAWFYNAYLDWFIETSQQMMGPGRTPNVNQQVIARPAAEFRRHHPVRDADDHDADLLGRKAVGHDRAAAHVAGDRRPDHPGEVPRRDGPLRRDARGHVPLDRDCSSTSAIPSGGPLPPATSGCC